MAERKRNETSMSSPSLKSLVVATKRKSLPKTWSRTKPPDPLKDRFKNFKKNITANPEKLGAPGRKPYFIYDKGINHTPKPLYDTAFEIISDKLFTGLPLVKPARITNLGKAAEMSASSSMTSLISRASISRRSSPVARSVGSLGIVSVAEISFGSLISVSEADLEDEEFFQYEDKAPSMFRLREDPPPRKREVENHFKITLEESETMFLLEIPTTAVIKESEEGAMVSKMNEVYERVKSSSKTVSHTATQTTRLFQKHMKLYVPRNQRASSSAYVTVWDIYDKMLESRKLSNVSSLEGEGMVSGIKSSEDVYPEEEFIYKGTMFGKEFLNALMVMERLVVRNSYDEKQLLFQGITSDPLSVEVNYNYSLSHLWTFACGATKDRTVTSICGNPKNGNILAVGYGKFKYTDSSDGLVCIWNVKNPKDPERKFNFKDPVTFVSFSPKRTHVLAVSFYSGLILILDIIGRSVVVKANNNHYPIYFPVTQTLWFRQPDEPHDFQVLLACGKNGLVYRYKKTNAFYSNKIMSLSRPYGTIEGVRQPRKCYARKTQVSRYPSAEILVRHPTDPMAYVVGSGEGYVYFCSVDHRHDHLESFVAHVGPIYNIQFNPFCSKIFLTCGADWCIRVWAEGVFEPLITLESGMSPVQHALWSPLHSTVIVSITGQLVEIWDIRRRTSTPKSSTVSPSTSLNTVIHFTQNKSNLCVGDLDGNVHVMALTEMPFIPTFQEVVLAQSLRNTLVTRPDLLGRLEKLGQPFTPSERKLRKNQNLATSQSTA